MSYPRDMQHYLITLSAMRFPVNIHCYLMCNDRRSVENAISRIMDEAEERRIELLGVALVTPLSSGIETVRRITASQSPEIAKMMAEATDYHISAFGLISDTPDDKILMEIH